MNTLQKSIACKKESKEFWEWFLRKSDDYYFNLEKEQTRLLDEFSEQLYKVNPTLGNAFSLIDKKTKKRTLTLSANNRPANIPFVEEIVQSAPKEKLKRWTIISFNQKNTLPSFLEFENGTVSTEDMYFEYSSVQNGIEINVFVKDYDKSNTYTGAVGLLIEAAVGEYDVLNYIKMIRVGRLGTQKNKEDLMPLKELPKIITKIKKH